MGLMDRFEIVDTTLGEGRLTSPPADHRPPPAPSHLVPPPSVAFWRWSRMPGEPEAWGEDLVKEALERR
jgi:hypothetical protein